MELEDTGGRFGAEACRPGAPMLLCFGLPPLPTCKQHHSQAQFQQARRAVLTHPVEVLLNISEACSRQKSPFCLC